MAKRTCSVDGCERSNYSRGWCSRHYARWQRHGDPLGGHPGVLAPPIERFRAKYIVADNGCWLWTAGKHDGYGRITVDERGYFAHRWSYEYHVGPIPDGLLVLHHCDTPACVNPEHVFVGTQADNMADMVAKGRQGVRGGRNRRLTLEQEAGIRAAYTGERGEQKALAERYGLSPGSMHRIVHNTKRVKKRRHDKVHREPELEARDPAGAPV
jgi:hypothetical protein